MRHAFHLTNFVLFALVAATLIAGCTAAPSPEPTAEQFRSAGAGGAIALTVDGLPVDESGDEPAELSITAATQRALNCSPEIQQALARAHAAWADARQTRLLPNPILNVAIRFPLNDGGDTVIDAGISEDLLAVLTLPRRVSAADQRLRAATTDVLVTVLDLIAEVQEQYLSVQSADAELMLLDDRRKLIQRLHQVARSRVEMGEAPQLDAIAVEADLAALEVEIAEKRTEQRLRRLALARLIGQPSGRADWELAAWSAEPSPGAIAERDLIRIAVQHRPEVQARQWELAALGDDLQLAQWGVLDGAEIGVDAEKESDWSVGPAVSTPLPLFDWGHARRDKARAQLIEARHRLTQTQRQIIQEVRQASVELDTAQAALAKVHDELFPLQERRREQADAAYRNGLADITTLLLAEQGAQATRSKLIELQRKVSLARVRLHRAVGGSGLVDGSSEASEASTTSPATQASD